MNGEVGDGPQGSDCEYQCPVNPPLTTDVYDDPTGDPSLLKDDDCDGNDGNIEACVFVSASLGDDAAGDGTTTHPFRTITTAIGFAGSGVTKRPVCVSGEVYNESIQMLSGVSVYGGFDHLDPVRPFKRKPVIDYDGPGSFSPVVTTINALGTGVYAPTIDSETHLEGLKINVTSEPAANDGASTYGVRLGGGNGMFWIRWNDITVGDGHNGANGADASNTPTTSAPGGNSGQAGTKNGSSGGGGGPAPSCAIPGGKGGDGGYGNQSGSNGDAGDGGLSGGSGNGPFPCCFGNFVNGDCGEPAAGNGTGDSSGGANGLQGQAGGDRGTANASLYVPASGLDGVAGGNGKGGGGGGGGGGGKGGGAFGGCQGSIGSSSDDRGGGGGSGGCGGVGGANGKGGQGGGGSFGIFIAAGNATVLKNFVLAGKGGNGGKGSDGRGGQPGGPGASGGTDGDNSAPGGNGGDGGKGGAGGPGGGGGGGISACVAYKPGAANIGTAIFAGCTTGQAGIGGFGGTNPLGTTASQGATGTAGSTVALN